MIKLDKTIVCNACSITMTPGSVWYVVPDFRDGREVHACSDPCLLRVAASQLLLAAGGEVEACDEPASAARRLMQLVGPITDLCDIRDEEVAGPDPLRALVRSLRRSGKDPR